MPRTKARSAGLLVYRVRDGVPEVLIGHMGGPFWAKKDEGAWSVFKGEYEDSEDPLAAARREFEEETGSPPPDGTPLALGEVRQSSGKRVIAWAVEGDLDPATVVSNTFTTEWPPRSGRRSSSRRSTARAGSTWTPHAPSWSARRRRSSTRSSAS